ncbi:MAG: RNA polymerase sigma factor, partial [Spirochaetales bacterium]
MSEAEDSGKSDLLIINEVIRGNTGAFAGIIKEYQQPIMRLALSYLKSREAAEDAVQEIFIRAYRSLRTFSLDKRFRPWLYSLAVNHLKSSYRKRLRRFAVDVKGSSLETPAYRDPQETAELHETAEEIRKAVRALPAGLREVTLLYYLEGL